MLTCFAENAGKHETWYVQRNTSGGEVNRKKKDRMKKAGGKSASQAYSLEKAHIHL